MIRKIASRLLVWVTRLSRQHGILFYLYSLTIGGCLTREIKSVYAGIKKHRQNCQSSIGCEFRLRRNIHRLEKGLIMRPRRPVFAYDYIEETVSDFISIWQSAEPGEQAQLHWFRDVLNQYFAAVENDAFIQRHKERFLAVLEPHSQNAGALIPKARKEYPPCPVSYEDFMQLTRIRRSVRWYQQRPVQREQIDKAILAAAQSPSACNRQPFEFRVFDDPEKVSQIAKIPMGTAGFSHQFPAIVVLVGDLSAYSNERDRHVIYIDASLAAMSFMLALETLGLSSCSINWPDIAVREKAMQKALNLQAYQKPVMLISLGYADPEGNIPCSDKKALNALRKYNS